MEIITTSNRHNWKEELSKYRYQLKNRRNKVNIVASIGNNQNIDSLIVMNDFIDTVGINHEIINSFNIVRNKSDKSIFLLNFLTDVVKK